MAPGVRRGVGARLRSAVDEVEADPGAAHRGRGGGDTGADPNKLVAIIDNLKSTTLPAHEQFVTLRSAGFGEVLRGVSLTPGTFEFGTPSF